MYEYTLMNIETNETEIIFGYDLKDAARRSNIELADYQVMFFEYID